MAQDSDLSKTPDKGKGKAVEGDRKPEEVQKDKDGNPVPNGKKDDKASGLFRLPDCGPRRHCFSADLLTMQLQKS